MDKRPDDEDELAKNLGAYAVGGAPLVGARYLGGLLGERPSGLGDLGPAPIGSDPWLFTEVSRALARERDLDLSGVTVDVEDAVVTLRGTVAQPSDVARCERAAGAVQGIKRLRQELAAR